VAIRKLREGSYFPDWLLERRRRAERALTTVVTTCYLLGVSTRRMEKLVNPHNGDRSPGAAAALPFAAPVVGTEGVTGVRVGRDGAVSSAQLSAFFLARRTSGHMCGVHGRLARSFQGEPRSRVTAPALPLADRGAA
jgi:Transposase, Mutator family